MFSKLKQIKDMRAQAKKIQGALSSESVETASAGGRVKVAMNGNQEVTAVTIDPTLLVVPERERLQSAIKDATNDAIKRIQRIMAAKVKEMGGLDLPK